MQIAPIRNTRRAVPHVQVHMHLTLSQAIDSLPQSRLTQFAGSSFSLDAASTEPAGCTGRETTH